jgi:hypothetical protein
VDAVKPALAALFYRLPVDLRPLVKNEIDGMATDKAAALVQERFGWALSPMLDQDAYFADQKQTQADAENGHRGGVTTSRKRRMGLIPAADPSGKKWKPDYRAPLNRAVFPKWGKVPVYVPPLVRFMSPLVAKTIIIIGDGVDHLGDFVLPRAQHAEQIGASEREAYRALQVLREAGLIEPRIKGDRNQATVWRYAEVAKVNTVHARQVLQAAKRKAADRVDVAKKKIVGAYAP